MPDLPQHLRLTGDGVILREFTEDDLPAIVELFNDPATERWYPLRPPSDLTVAKELLEKTRLGRQAGAIIRLAITTDEKELKGEIVLNVAARVLSFTVGAPYRRQGLAKRAARTMIEYARDVMHISTLAAQIEPDNCASIGVVEAVGFRPTDAEPTTFEHVGRTFTVLTWRIDLNAGPPEAADSARG